MLNKSSDNTPQFPENRLWALLVHGLLFISPFAIAQTNPTIPERNVVVAQPAKPAPVLPEASQSQVQAIQVSEQELRADKNLTERLLNQAIDSGNVANIEALLKIYQQFDNTDGILVRFAQAQLARKRENYSQAIVLYRQILAERPELTPVRIQLAITLFQDRQDNAAKDQFEKALSDEGLPEDIARLVNVYLQALNRRGEWQVSFSASYQRERNINNASKSPNIENTPFVKNPAMLPQRANGIRYSFDLERDFNLSGAHYLHFANTFYGKSYWDKHDYDDITNRTYLGYAHKSAVQNWSVLPFYERQWYGNKRYKWASGVRGEFNRWLSANWQLSGAVEYSKERYHTNADLKGNSKLVSLTLLWRPKPQRFFYTGADFTRQKAQVAQYSYDLKTARIGWGEEWGWGISSRLSFSYSYRDYKDNLSLGNVFHFDKRRKDKSYQVNAFLWKRDWHLWGITPKLHYRWRNQKSNFSTLYSYKDNSVNILFEKTF